MKKNLLIVLALAFVLSLVVACSTPTPTPLPPIPASSKASEAPKATDAPKATAVPPTATAVPPTATVVQPTATKVPPTATTAPASSAASSSSVASSSAASSSVATSSASAPATATGLFVADVRLQPTAPAFNQNISFFVTFNNTDTKPFTANWKLLIYRADIVTKSDNETSVVNTSFAPGKSEVAALGSYKYGATGRTCEYFFARVVWLDNNNQNNQFTTVEGKVFDKGFQICDVATIATNTPAPTQPTNTPVPPTTSTLGLFVTGMRLDPAQPGHGQDITFYPTFNNAGNAVVNYAWKIYVYNAASPANPVLDTTPVPASFAAGSTTEGKSGSTYRYGTTGNQCDYFFARVGFQDGDKRNFYTTPDGKIFEKGFSICN